MKLIILTALMVFLLPGVPQADIFDASKYADKITEGDTAKVSIDVSGGYEQDDKEEVEFKLSTSNGFRIDDHLLFLGAKGKYKEKNWKTDEERSMVHLRYRYYINSIWALESFGQHEHHLLKQIDHRVLAGVGARGLFKISDLTKLSFGLHPMYERLDRIDEVNVYNQFRVSSYIRGDLSYEDTDFSLVGYIQPKVDAPDDFRAIASFGLSQGITEWLFFGLDGSIDYDSTPAATAPKYLREIGVSVGVEKTW